MEGLQSSRKLLVVTDDAVGGGTAHVARKVALGLSERFSLQFAGGYDRDDAFVAPLTERNIPLVWFSATERNLAESTYALRKARAFLDETRPDCILCVDAAELSSLLALKSVAHERGIPYVMVVNLLSEDCLERFAKYIDKSREGLRRAAAIIFVSDANRRRFEKFFPQLDVPLHVVPNGIAERYFAGKNPEKRVSLRRELNIGDSDLFCLTAARLEPRKGQLVTLEALAQLKSKAGLTNIRLVLAGEGARADIVKHIERLGLQDQVQLLGARSDIPDLLDASDVFILSSYAEGMPLCIGEALAKGVPVLASDVDGIPEQIDPSCGVLLPSPGVDFDACVARLAEALQNLVSDRSRLASMGQAAAEKARRLFTLQTMQLAYRSIVEPIAEAARPVGGYVSKITHDEAVDVIDFSNNDLIWELLDEGWSATDNNGMWTDGRTSTMKFRPVDLGGPLRLAFTVRPFTTEDWPTQKTDVYADGALISSWQLTGGQHRRLAFELPTELHGKEIEIRFEHHCAVSPETLGLGADSRRLALFFERMDVGEPSDLRSFDFGEPAEVWDFLVDGWSSTENGGMWTSGETSTMKFRLADSGKPMHLAFTLEPFTCGQWPEQETDVYVDGVLAASWELAGGGSRRLELEIGEEMSGKEVEIRFEHRRAISPEKLGLSSDPRQLALFFSRLDAREIGAAENLLRRLKRNLLIPLKTHLTSGAKPS